MNKKILIILGSMGRGGAEKVISIIANDYANNGWSVTIGLLLSKEVGYKLHPNVNIVDLSFGGGSRLRRVPKWLVSIRKLIVTLNPNVVLSFAARINVITLVSSLGLNNKIVISERNDPRNDGRGIIVNALCNLLYLKAFKIIFQTRRSMDYFSDKIKEKGIIIPNPISINCYRKQDCNKKVVNVGRLTKQKNQELLIKAFSKISKEFPDVKLWIYGEGELRPKLENLITDLQLTNKVIMPGNIVDIHEKIADASIFVLSSDYEGLSNALLEAMVMGLPVISTNCAGADELITDGVNGVIIPVKDEEKLAEELRILLSKPDYRKALGENARFMSKCLRKDIVLKKWHDVLD